ncbi:L,D-transpeptidase family protein [Anaeromicropila herbilytica]|uniref:L,D-TPase catalytic domain-containing protein n=1 Tax=Anaeromicropila herbilytica TaxID=2785025 RepID=A0A7R7IDR4_9FIRM|nr:immunoglobulin-like domain-containing protein [Anaeromicropila herbilytica]BCN31998.1 hypothetical protein bsdtb5_32930 [Anaeromicropila herbilytica]
MIKLFKRTKLQSCCMILLALLIIGTVMSNNTKSSASSTAPYLIKVNRYMNCITIYKKDKTGEYTVPYKAMACSTGGANTLLGTYKTPAKFRWKLLMGDVWGQYSTRIKGGILFHSVWYYKQDPSTLSAVQFNKLGTTASHGCIRLSVVDAKWIYDNCPLGTTVIIYDSKDPGPLGKPEAMKMPTSSGWDPTDPLSNNPWANKSPSIAGATNRTIKYGSKVNVLSGVSAKSSTGYSITGLIQVSGTVNTRKAGTYKVTYEVTEASGKSAKRTVTYKVLRDDRKPTLTGIKNRLVNGTVTINRALAIKGVTAKFDGKVLSDNRIKVTFTKASANKYIVTYHVVVSNGNSVTKKSTIVVDKTAPVLHGIKNKMVSGETDVTRTYALKGVTATDNGKTLSQSKIKVAISYVEDHWNIVYKITDNAGNVTKKTAKFTVIDGAVIYGVKNQTVTSDVVVDEEFAMNGVTGYIDAVNATDKIKVTISELVDNQYTITYSLTDNGGYEETAEAVITVKPSVVIKGATDRVISSATPLTKEIALQGVTATEGSDDVTDSIEVTISDLVDNKYTVTYTVVDSNGYAVETKVVFTVVSQ